MIIAAVSDIHGKDNFSVFRESAENIPNPDLFLLAGDIIKKGDIYFLPRILGILSKFSCPKIACFGNEGYAEIRENIISSTRPGIRWLDEESVVLDIKGKKIGISGSAGSLERPTHWQNVNIPDIREQYEKRRLNMYSMLAGMKANFKIAMMHYSPTHETLRGENESSWPWLADSVMGKTIARALPDIVVHGHAHKGNAKGFISRVPVFNVSLPARGEITMIDTDDLPKPGLWRF